MRVYIVVADSDAKMTPSWPSATMAAMETLDWDRAASMNEEDLQSLLDEMRTMVRRLNASNGATANPTPRKAAAPTPAEPVLMADDPDAWRKAFEKDGNALPF